MNLEPTFYIQTSRGLKKIIPEFYNSDDRKLTYQEILNPMIQPYSSNGKEVILSPYSESEYIVSYSSKLNNNNNYKSSVNIGNIINTYNNSGENKNRLLKKYRVVKYGEDPVYISSFNWVSELMNPTDLNNDIIFLEKYLKYLKDFYIGQANKHNVNLTEAVNQEIPLLNISPEIVNTFDELFEEELHIYNYLADKLPSLGLKGIDVYSNPFILYKKIEEIKNDYTEYKRLTRKNLNTTRNMIRNINKKINSSKTKTKRHNNNRNVKRRKFTMKLPSFVPLNTEAY